MEDRLMTIPQVAEYLQLSKSKVYAWAKKGKIPTVRIGKNVRIRESALKQWLAGQEVQGEGDVWYTPGW